MSETRLALVTGASSGIGFELARQFAQHGYDVIATAEDDGINDVPKRLAEFDSHIEPIQVDLRTAEAVEYLYTGVVAGGRTLAAAALNAGIGRGDSFVNSDLTDDLSIVDLNVRSAVHLAKLVLRDMVEHGEGKVLFTSSVASMIPGSYQAVYHASKSFVQSFAEALRDELRDTGVRDRTHAGTDRDQLFPPREDGRHACRTLYQGRPGDRCASGLRRADARRSEGRRGRRHLEDHGDDQSADARSREGTDEQDHLDTRRSMSASGHGP